jgi:DNA repair ATPase RecN
MATDNTERLLGEISSDVKHILLRTDKQDERLNRQEKRLNAVEAFQWKLVGIATAVPTFLTTLSLSLKYILPS